MRLLAAVCSFQVVAALAPYLTRHAATRVLQGSEQAYSTNYFEQAIDHFPKDSRYAPHTKGTFQQRYYLESSSYKPGGPVFVFIGGEVPIEYYDTLFENSLIQDFIQKFQGIGVVLENRYYGESYPFNMSTTDDLLYMTTEQTIADLNSFARNVKLPGLDNINAPKTPWILWGGSLAGALSAFTMKTYGDTYYAGISSSGVIHAQVGYPEWYDPIQLLAPQDCVASINNIVDNIDLLVDAKQTTAIQRLKDIFGLGSIKDIRDFAQTIAFPIGGPFKYPTNTWQELNWNPQSGSEDFFYFCRNVTDVNTTKNNTDVDYEFSNYTNGEPWTNLGNYAAYIKRVVLPYCPSGDYNSVDCFGTQDQSFWANATNGYIRSYMYTSCLEFGAYQVAQPRGKKSLISRVLDVGYTQEWCNWSFPKGKYNSIPKSPDLNRWNGYGGLNLTADRLLYIDGSADPWRGLCYHSQLAPEREWGNRQQEHLINGAGHCWDLPVDSDLGSEPQFIREAHFLEIRTIEKWLKEFSSWKHTAA